MAATQPPGSAILEPTAPSDVAAGGGGDVVARGYWEQAWLRLKKDRVALASGVVLIVFILTMFIGAPVAQHILGHGPNDIISGGVENFQPVGPMSHVETGVNNETTTLVLGASDLTGRDELLRLLYGGQVSLEVGILATIFGVMLGVMLGMLAGYYGGLLDAIISRLVEVVMAFPLLLFLIALAAVAGDRLNAITVFGLFYPGVFTVVSVITLFSWFYPARIVRAQVLALREREFVEAARMVGSSNFRIMRSHLLPHLTGTIIIYGTLTVATNILAESTLSFLGVGLPAPNPSWGNLLDSAAQLYSLQPWLILWPGLALLILALAFNLLGDGLQDALDPRAIL
jgi:ABC-type dipeptide/oligopeptide/nickel transport system permease subunit